jgi:hypothetical protein
VLALVMLTIEIALAWWYRDAFRALLASRVAPRTNPASARPVERAATSNA